MRSRLKAIKFEKVEIIIIEFHYKIIKSYFFFPIEIEFIKFYGALRKRHNFQLSEN